MPLDGKPPSTAAAWLPWLGVALGIALLWTVAIPSVQSAADERPAWASWDLRTYFLPKFVYGSQEILEWRLPAWNPFEGTGLPLLGAIQPAALYPPKILAFALPDADVATRIFLVGHFLLLGAGFLCFASVRGIGPHGAFAGAVLWTFNPAILLSNHNPNRIANLVWIPIVFALAERVVHGSRSAWLGLAAAVAAMLLAGYFIFVSDTALLLGVVAAASWASGVWRMSPQRSWPLLGAAFLVGGLLASAQLLPAFDVVEASERVVVAGRQALAFDDAGLRTSGLLVGVPVLVGLGLGGLRRREVVAPLTGCLVALLVVAGAWKLIRLLPGLEATRHPLTWFYVVQFPLAWWAAVGADALTSPRDASERRLGAGVLAVTGSAWGLFCLVHWLGPASHWPPPPPIGVAVHRMAGPVGGLGVAGLLGLIAAGGMLLAALRRDRARALALGVALAAAAAGQIAAFPFGASLDAFDRPGEPFRSRNLGLPAAASDGRVFSMVDAYLGFSARDRVENLLWVEGSFEPPRLAALRERLRIEVHRQSADWRLLARARGLLDALDVSSIVAPRHAQRWLERAGLRDTGLGDESRVVLANEDRPGRAWVVFGVREVDGPEAALERLLSPRFDPRRQALLETTPRGNYPRRSPRAAIPATVRYPKPSVAEIEIELPRRGILVLADACYPGWQAQVDERPVEWFCANYLARGVELEAGHHRVRFEYRPRALRVGLALSGATALALVLAALWTWRRRPVP